MPRKGAAPSIGFFCTLISSQPSAPRALRSIGSSLSNGVISSASNLYSQVRTVFVFKADLQFNAVFVLLLLPAVSKHQCTIRANEVLPAVRSLFRATFLGPISQGGK